MLQTLNELSATTKRNDKINILKEIEDAETFKRVAQLTYDPQYDYYIKEFERPTKHFNAITLTEAMDVLEESFNGGKLRGNAAEERLYELLSDLSEDDAEVLTRIVKRDLRCGVSSSTVNKVWPNLVYIHPYARCSSYNEKNMTHIKTPCYAQTKMDGLYVDIMVYDGKVEYRSRQASFLPFNQEDFDQRLVNSANGYVLQGEALMVDDEGNVLSREAGNGTLNSDEIDLEKIKFVCWDVIPIGDFKSHKTKVPYFERLAQLEGIVEDLSIPSLEVVDYIMVDNADDIIGYFKEQVEHGHEGAVIKNRDFCWKHGTLKDQVKMKIIFDCDLVVTDWFYGKEGTKYAEAVGSIEVQSSDGKIKFNVGTGFKDKERFDLLETIDDKIESGTVVKVKGNGIVTNKNDPEYHALYLGRFAEFRIDKTEADSLEKVQEIIDSYTETLQNII